VNRKPRRIVTGHDDAGRSMVMIDEEAVLTRAMRPGVSSSLLWWTDAVPANNDGREDLAAEVVGTTVEDGAVFRVVQYDPGVAPRRHRTHSIDFAVVLSGEIDLELDKQTVTLRAGDFLVQRGSIHNWINRSDAPAVVAFVLVAAKPFAGAASALPEVG
jgi:quercetin dioxygenase-like cupin family protein